MDGMAHKVTLIEAELRSFREANEALSKRRRAKKIRIRQEGSAIVGKI